MCFFSRAASLDRAAWRTSSLTVWSSMLACKQIGPGFSRSTRMLFPGSCRDFVQVSLQKPISLPTMEESSRVYSQVIWAEKYLQCHHEPSNLLKGFIPAWPSLLQSGCNPCVFFLDKGLAELNSEKCTWLVTLRKLSDNDINHCWLNNTYLERSDTNMQIGNMALIKTLTGTQHINSILIYLKYYIDINNCFI